MNPSVSICGGGNKGERRGNLPLSLKRLRIVHLPYEAPSKAGEAERDRERKREREREKYISREKVRDRGRAKRLKQ